MAKGISIYVRTETQSDGAHLCDVATVAEADEVVAHLTRAGLYVVDGDGDVLHKAVVQYVLQGDDAYMEIIAS